jgi:hypothetical protein
VRTARDQRRPRRGWVAALAALSGAACGASGEVPRAAPRAAAPARAPDAFVTPSRLVPDVVRPRGLVAEVGGERRLLTDRMRIIDRDDGTIDRAAELFPAGTVRAIDLPSRLGGGTLFFATNPGGTQLFRSATWLGALVPLVQVSSIADEVVPGFDRLYLRLSSAGRLVALDARSGEAVPLALPPATSFGKIGFADGWRAIVTADLRGPLATFDAGATWTPLDVGDPVLAIDVTRGDPRVVVRGGEHRVDARGGVTFLPLEQGSFEALASHVAGLLGRAPPARAEAVEDGVAMGRGAPGPLGARPLRAAVEDGFPDSPTTAIVARGGALHRVSLPRGAVVETRRDAYPDREARCHAVRVGHGQGFVCGEHEGATSIYAFEPPLAVRELARFARPRFVASSGNGALVIRGGCGDAPPDDDARGYCVRSRDGALREIRLRGGARDASAERVVALADGRVAVLVPPRADGPGQLSLVGAGGAVTHAPLKLPVGASRAARAVRDGLWLEGFEEREPGVLSGWVEAGGPVAGVRVALDGEVTAGEAREDVTAALVSGPFALLVREGGRAAESTDGGRTFRDLDLPEIDEDPAAFPTRSCGPVGCSVGPWIRVGWGEPALKGDLAQVDSPKSLAMPFRASEVISLRCEPSTRIDTSAPPPPSRRPGHAPSAPAPAREGDMGVWLPLRHVAPPALAAGEVGFDSGGLYDSVAMRAYAWGLRGADWSRAGRMLVRFDDPFDAAGGVRSTARGLSPYATEVEAAEQLGAASRGTTWAWSAELDPGGRAALVSACKGGACSLFAVAEGQSVQPIRSATGAARGAFPNLVPDGAVRLGETWFFLVNEVSAGATWLVLHRVDLGVARPVARYPRSGVQAALPPPRLVRRASGGGLGLIVTVSLEPGFSRVGRGALYVLPIDPDDGALGEPALLGRRDLAGVQLSVCAPRDDGWLIDTTLEVGPNIDLAAGHASFDAVQVRLRLDPGLACLEGVAARLDGYRADPGARPARGGAAPAMGALSGIPLAATDRATGKRFAMRCEKR